MHALLLALRWMVVFVVRGLLLWVVVPVSVVAWPVVRAVRATARTPRTVWTYVDEWVVLVLVRLLRLGDTRSTEDGPARPVLGQPRTGRTRLGDAV